MKLLGYGHVLRVVLRIFQDIGRIQAFRLELLSRSFLELGGGEEEEEGEEEGEEEAEEEEEEEETEVGLR